MSVDRDGDGLSTMDGVLEQAVSDVPCGIEGRDSNNSERIVIGMCVVLESLFVS
jgi:hypothetical protein